MSGIAMSRFCYSSSTSSSTSPMPPILKSSSYSSENLSYLQALTDDKPTLSGSSLSVSSIVASVLIQAREVREPARVRVTKSTVRPKRRHFEAVFRGILNVGF
jgi:hypothetical protein